MTPPGAHRLARTLLQTVRISLIRYFDARFLRWILPLKLRSTTVEETAARPMVPHKATPSLRTKEVCSLGWRGISSCTSPRTERALTSAEVLSGTTGFNVATVAGKAVVAVITEIADVADSTAGGDDLDQRTIDAAKSYVAAERVDFDVPVLHIGQSDRAIESLDVHVGIADVADVNGRRCAFQRHVAVQFFRAQCAGYWNAG